MRILLLAMGLALACAASAAPLKVVSEAPAVQIGATQFIVHSESVGRDFLVKVSAPMAPTPTGTKRPAIYALDGGYEVAGPIAWVLGGAGVMEPAFVVSVGYQPSDYHWRDDDLAHKPYRDEHGRMVGGKAAAFQAFLIEELKPFIESRFPVDAGRSILFGHSLGGVFTAHVLAERSGLFSGYVIASPAVWSDPGLLNRLHDAAPRLDGRAFLAVGGAEPPRMLKGEADLVEALKTPGSRIAVRSEVFHGATHIAYYPALVTAAFPWLLPPKP